MLPDFRLDGRTALVTGAGRGLGKGIAQALAAAGAKVTLISRSEDEIQAVSQDIIAAGSQAEFHALDVTDLGAMTEMIRQNGPFNILVNNAGRNIPALTVDVSAEDYDAIMSLNVKSAFFLAQSVGKGLIHAGQSGSIINISSQMGHVGSSGRSVYCASKHAMEGFTKAMAIEWGRHNIRVNTICPTFIETPLTKPFLADEAFRSLVVKKIHSGRIGKVEDVTGAAVFLASDASSLITGTALKMDGGWTAE